MATVRIDSLDGWRAASIALVLYGHADRTHGFPALDGIRLVLGDMGNLGVNVFFIISGFLITTLLIDERARTGRVSLRGFFYRRALRILPAAYVYLLALALAGYLGWTATGMDDLLVAATYLVNFDPTRDWNIGHLWSLSVEEQFYLVWPLAFVLLQRRHALALALVAFVVAPLVRAVMHRAYAGSVYADLEIFPAVADGIAIGCVFAILRPRLLATSSYLRITGSGWIWLALPAIFLVNRSRNHSVVDLLLWPCALIAIAVLIEASTRRRGTPAWKALNHPAVVFVGTLSYSLYLWQQPFLNRHVEAWPTAFPFNLALAVAAALLSHFLVERPFLRLRRPSPAAANVEAKDPMG